MDKDDWTEPDSYVIDMSGFIKEDKVIMISSDEEFPRQLRWNDIKDKYKELCGTSMDRKTIIAGYRVTKKPRLWWQRERKSSTGWMTNM